MRGTSGTKATRNMKDFLKSFMTKKKKYIYIYIYIHTIVQKQQTNFMQIRL